VKRRPCIAVLTRGEALGSIVKMILARSGDYRVVAFTSADDLIMHLRIAPAELVICDYHLDAWTAPELMVRARREAPDRQFDSIVMTSRIDRQLRESCAFADIGEVIIKPMSPVFLEERVARRLAGVNPAREPELPGSPPRRDSDNVVSLFDRRPTGSPRVPELT